MNVKIIAPEICLLEKGPAYQAGVAVGAGKILAAGPLAELQEAYPDAMVENWEHEVLMPGTVNAHNHSFQSLLRGIAADRPFLEWRDESLYKYSPKMRCRDIYTGALFAFAEMMKCGVTTVCDFFYLHNEGTAGDEAVIQAAHDLGIRLVLARTMYDWNGAPAGYVESIQDAYNNTKRLMQKYRGGMTKVIPAPHSLHAATPEMVQAGASLAREFGTPFHIHVAEERFEVEQVKEKFGTTPLRFLDRLSVVNDAMKIIHGVWLDAEEIALLGAQGGSLIYCPSSNMFLADGITDIPAYLKAGVPIALGSDGACGNNRISVLEEMRMVSILQKAKTCDALCVNYHDAYRMGTLNGGRVLDEPIGRLLPDYYADFIGIGLDDLSMQPLSKGGQLLPNIVYSLQPTAIRHVVVNGKTVLYGGQFTQIDTSELLARIRETMNYLES